MFINFICIVFRSAYAASKHAMQAFSDSLRAEVASHGIKVTVISPGYINTNLSQNALTGTGQKYNGKPFLYQTLKSYSN
jgi:dehydrogenase/reductase SDR family protein 7B